MPVAGLPWALTRDGHGDAGRDGNRLAASIHGADKLAASEFPSRKSDSRREPRNDLPSRYRYVFRGTRAGLYEQGKAIYETGGLKLAGFATRSRSKRRTIIIFASAVLAVKRPSPSDGVR